MEARGATEGERKTITALFADIKGSMALMEDLDPEEARALVDPALTLMMEAVHRYEGYVAQSTGDGIFAFFGAPIAHEDHPQRALYAALRMQEEINKYADSLRLRGQAPVEIRIGVNTGEVVLRSIRKDDLRTEYTPIGHSTGLASRMEGLAKAGSIVVSEQTQKLTEGYFTFKALGVAQVKGVSEPVNIYEVLGVGPLRTRLQVAARRGLTRFVGRQSEMEQLRHALDLTRAGHGQIVGVIGEPGVGKSRLSYEFKVLSHTGCLLLETFSVSHSKAYPYLPLIDLLRNYFHITVQDNEKARQEKITGKLFTLDRSLEDTLPYLFALLGITEAATSLSHLDPRVRRRRTLEAIKRILIRESLNQPVILIFEDLHWLDTESEAFLNLLSEGVANARVLLLVNFRPEYQHHWGTKTYYTHVRLDPLGPEDAGTLLTALLGSEAAWEPLKREILDKTEGNPFFIEEIVQALREQHLLDGGISSQAPPPTPLRLPATVRTVLASRIDRLSPEAKELLQTLAVMGKEFSFTLVNRVVPHAEDTLQHLLSQLQTAEFIYEQPAFPEVEYVFKHALTQEVAYNSLLLERRKVMHEQMAQTIEKVFGSHLDDHYNELSYHYSRSGNTQKAIEYLQLAGHQAVQRSANAVAINHLSTALALLRTLPDSDERTRRELVLQIALGVPLQAVKGFSAPEVEQVYLRAHTLSQQLGGTPDLFPALRGLWQFYLARGAIQVARELAEQLITIAQRSQDSALQLEAHHALGATLAFLGENRPARVALERGLSLYDAQQHHALAFRFGYDPATGCLFRVALCLCLLGYPDQARKKIEEAFVRAKELAHPPTLAPTLLFAAIYYHYCQDQHAVQEQTQAQLLLSQEHELSYFQATGLMFQGWALVKQGNEADGLAQMQQGLALHKGNGGVVLSVYLVLLTEAYRETNRPDEGLRVIGELLARIEEQGDRIYEAELYRLKGELLLNAERGTLNDELKTSSVHRSSFRIHRSGEAEACFLKALDVARRQEAKWWELRATTSLARLWQQQGKKDEARQMLADIYNWFTEGFATVDLKDAKTLLETLSS
ncbi:MAG: AAA family ATPase [Deltaproteobacteria bacterium]|nr:AAA family ATPase [Deltaproteobacteria bacterium]